MTVALNMVASVTNSQLPPNETFNITINKSAKRINTEFLQKWSKNFVLKRELIFDSPKRITPKYGAQTGRLQWRSRLPVCVPARLRAT